MNSLSRIIGEFWPFNRWFASQKFTCGSIDFNELRAKSPTGRTYDSMKAQDQPLAGGEIRIQLQRRQFGGATTRDHDCSLSGSGLPYQLTVRHRQRRVRERCNITHKFDVEMPSS